MSRISSFKYAFKGMYIFFSTQPNGIIHLFAAISVIVAGFWFNISTTDWCFIAIAIGLVMMAEVFNTAIEFLVNLVSPEYNELAGKVKDLAAAGVLIAAFAALVIGLIVFLSIET
ncbi:MAG: diacylglycerol kinase family protein [Bacteroidetes bacterium]|nr:diacylglycerol kinase family protein [Bacteroidota bacterium]